MGPEDEMDSSSMAPSDIIEDIDEDPQEVDEAAKVQKAISDLEGLVKHYQGVVVTASDTNDPEDLSSAMLRLARVNSALGRNAALANYLARNADRAARRYRAEKTLDYAGSMAVNKAELQSELDAKEAFTIASDAQLLADQASDLCFRTDTFMKMAQSRLSLIKSDAARG